MSFVSCIIMMSGCDVYASCLSSSFLLVMPLMFTCSMDMPVPRGVLIGLCGVLWVLMQVFCYLFVWVLSVVLQCGSEHLH